MAERGRGHGVAASSRGAWIALALAVAAVLLRWPLRSRYLNTWDSVLFALALDDYDVTAGRPHPPGYPVYIAMGRALHAFIADENTALVLLSLLLTAGAVLLLYGFVSSLGTPRAGLLAACLYAAHPIVTFNSVIATSYPGEAFFSVAVAWTAWRHLRDPSLMRAGLLAGVLALAIGYRQSSLFFLGPVGAYALLRARQQPVDLARRAATAAATGAAFCLAWFVPMVSASGGWSSYREAAGLQTRLVVFGATAFEHGWPAFVDLGGRFVLYIQWELRWLLPVGAVLVVIALAASARGRKLEQGEWWDAPRGMWPFVAVWTLPAVAFYLLVFNGWGEGPPGYILVILPAVYALFGWLADGAVRVTGARTKPHLRPAVVALMTGLALVPAAGYAAAWDNALQVQVDDHDEWTQAWLDLDSRFPPESSAIVARYSWAHVKWHHPDHILWSYLPLPAWEGHYEPWILMMQTQHRREDVSFYKAHVEGPTGREHPIPDGIQSVVLFDFQLAGEDGDERVLADFVDVKEAHLDNGWRVLYFDVDAEHAVIEDYFTYRPNVPLHLDDEEVEDLLDDDGRPDEDAA